jgi:hypothetical protein
MVASEAWSLSEPAQESLMRELNTGAIAAPMAESFRAEKLGRQPADTEGTRRTSRGIAGSDRE